MQLEAVKNILITNNYWVQIAKFKGKNVSIRSVIKFLRQSLILRNAVTVSYIQRYTQQEPWETRLYMNQKLLWQEPYAAKNDISLYRRNKYRSRL